MEEAKLILWGGEIISANDDRLQELSGRRLAQLGLVCVHCGQRVFLKRGDQKINHFSHFPKSGFYGEPSCPFRNTIQGEYCAKYDNWMHLREGKGQRLKAFDLYLSVLLNSGLRDLHALSELDNELENETREKLLMVLTHLDSFKQEFLSALQEKRSLIRNYVFFLNPVPKLQLEIAFEVVEYLCRSDVKCRSLEVLIVKPGSWIFLSPQDKVLKDLLVYSARKNYQNSSLMLGEFEAFRRSICFQILKNLIYIPWISIISDLEYFIPAKEVFRETPSSPYRAGIDTHSCFFVKGKNIYIGKVEEEMLLKNQLLGTIDLKKFKTSPPPQSKFNQISFLDRFENPSFIGKKGRTFKWYTPVQEELIKKSLEKLRILIMQGLSSPQSKKYYDPKFPSIRMEEKRVLKMDRSIEYLVKTGNAIVQIAGGKRRSTLVCEVRFEHHKYIFGEWLSFDKLGYKFLKQDPKLEEKFFHFIYGLWSKLQTTH